MQEDTQQASPGVDNSQADPNAPIDLDALLPLQEGDDDGDHPDADASDAAQDDEHEDKDADEDEKPDDEKDAPKAEALTDDSKVPLDDGREVSVAELKKSFQDFSLKTQEYAQRERETLVQAREAIAQHAEQQAAELHALAEGLMAMVAPGYDAAAMHRLSIEDPQTYWAIKARLSEAEGKRAEIAHKAQQAIKRATEQREAAQREQQTARAELLKAESAKLAGQKWFNEDFRTKAVAYATKHGIPPAELQGIAYAGYFEMLRKSMLYDEASQRAKTKAPPKPAIQAQPGASPARGGLQQKRNTDAAVARARQTNSRLDIGNAIEALLPLR